MIFDRQGRCLKTNRTGLCIMGYEESDVHGKRLTDLFSGKFHSGIEAAVGKALAGEQASFDADQIRQGSSTLIWNTILTPIYDRAGNVYRFAGIFTDVTEQKQTRQMLLESENKFRNLLETIHLAAVILDCAGNITFCNDHLLGITGWSRDEVINRNWFDLFIPEESKGPVRKVFNLTVLKSAVPLHYENPIVTREGVLRQIVWDNTLLLDTEGNVTGIASIGYDVTDHRKLEEQFRHFQKMEAIGQLAGGVAHDFNNILTAIIGYSHLMLVQMKDDDPLKVNLEQILQASDRATTLTQSLLAFSRKQVMNPKPNDLNGIVTRLEKFLLRLIRENIELTTSCAEDDLMVFADSGQIEQVLINLVTNARDAMPAGGRIAIRTESLQMDKGFIEAHGYGHPGKYALIFVSDTGTGMDTRTKERIFEPFFTTKEQGKGTGLGLSMAYGIITQHGGHIDVYSEPGRGTTFKIYLPLFRGVAAVESEAEEHVPASGGTETILIAEDDDALRKLTSTILSNYGYRVITAVDGEDAVTKYGANSDLVQLIILDCVMPKKNGKEAFQEIRMINPAVRAIFISGYAEELISKEGLLEPGINFILKPLTPSTLLKKVREVMDA